MNKGINWQDKDEVFHVAFVGEMASILITAMEWEKEFLELKQALKDKIDKTSNGVMNGMWHKQEGE